MIIRKIYPKEKEKFNRAVVHPLQSWEWGEFREKTGVKVVRIGLFDKKALKAGFQLTIHPLPKTKYNIGYLPKSTILNKQILSALKEIGQKNNCIFIKIEPNLTLNQPRLNRDGSRQVSGEKFFLENGCVLGRPLFTKYTFQIDLTGDEEALFSQMKSKTRYNIRIAQKHDVKVIEDNSSEAFNEYLKLTFETVKRQKFYAHDRDYHRKMWQALHPAGIVHLLAAIYQGKTLVSWMVFIFNNVLYYPYGASSREHRNVMASNLMMWEAIRFGKKMGCHTFDLWGCLGPDPNPKDPWYGFHRFKLGYGPKLVEFIGTFDLIINQSLYRFYNFADSLRWKYLKLKTLFQ